MYAEICDCSRALIKVVNDDRLDFRNRKKDDERGFSCAVIFAEKRIIVETCIERGPIFKSIPLGVNRPQARFFKFTLLSRRNFQDYSLHRSLFVTGLGVVVLLEQ